MGSAEAWAYRLDRCFCSSGSCLDLGDGKNVIFIVVAVISDRIRADWSSDPHTQLQQELAARRPD